MLLALVFMKSMLIGKHGRYYYTSFYRDTETSRFLRQTLCSIGCNVSCELDLQVQIVDWMRGQTCGLCGKADGEIKQEFRTPNGFLTKNPVTYAHSWILPAESCKGTSGETWERSQQLWHAEHACDPTQLQPPSIHRVPNQAWIHRAGEAGGRLRSGIEMFLRSACAALHARLLPCEDHPRHCWLPLRGCWWVHTNIESSNEMELVASLFLCTSLQNPTWRNLRFSEVSMRRALTWWKELKLTWPAAARLSVFKHTLQLSLFLFCFERHLKIKFHSKKEWNPINNQRSME